MELRELVRWSGRNGVVLSERHGAMTGIMKAQIDWIPLSEGAVRPSQGKNSGSYASVAVHSHSTQSTDARAWSLDENDHHSEPVPVAKAPGRSLMMMDVAKPSPYYDRIVDVMEELMMKFTLLNSGNAAILPIATANKGVAEELSAGNQEQNRGLVWSGCNGIQQLHKCVLAAT